MIPQASPPLRIARFRKEVDLAISNTLSSSNYILGPAVERFESEFATYTGLQHCVGVASGTDALALALRAMGIKSGDEVITTALTFSGTAQAILHCGAQPRFVDVDPMSRCIAPAAIEAAITHKTAAIIPVHLFGHAADMPRIMDIADRHHLAVVEDCAQAHGASINGRLLGSFGHAAAYSFYPTKNLGAIGDAGAIITNDETLRNRLRSLRHYGTEGGQKISQTIGFNSRMDELQAAILSVMLKHLDEGNRERRALADEYRRELAGLDLTLPQDHAGAVYHQFAIEFKDRDKLADQLLKQKQITTAIHYSPPLHRHPAFKDTVVSSLIHTERLSAQLLSLPIQPEVAGGNVSSIARSIAEIIQS